MRKKRTLICCYLNRLSNVWVVQDQSNRDGSGGGQTRNLIIFPISHPSHFLISSLSDSFLFSWSYLIIFLLMSSGGSIGGLRPLFDWLSLSSDHRFSVLTISSDTNRPAVLESVESKLSSRVFGIDEINFSPVSVKALFDIQYTLLFTFTRYSQSAASAVQRISSGDSSSVNIIEQEWSR